MNHAICLKCGTAKPGALATCARCGFKPLTSDDRGKSVLLSDKCAPMASLAKVAKRIQKGEKLKFDDADVLKWSDLLDSLPRAPKMVMGLSVRHWMLLAITIGSAVAMGVCALSWMELR